VSHRTLLKLHAVPVAEQPEQETGVQSPCWQGAHPNNFPLRPNQSPEKRKSACWGEGAGLRASRDQLLLSRGWWAVVARYLQTTGFFLKDPTSCWAILPGRESWSACTAYCGFFFFFVVLGFELRAYTLSHSISPFL
jgi:hypothetical protein